MITVFYFVLIVLSFLAIVCGLIAIGYDMVEGML